MADGSFASLAAPAWRPAEGRPTLLLVGRQEAERPRQLARQLHRDGYAAAAERLQLGRHAIEAKIDRRLRVVLGGEAIECVVVEVVTRLVGRLAAPRDAYFGAHAWLLPCPFGQMPGQPGRPGAGLQIVAGSQRALLHPRAARGLGAPRLGAGVGLGDSFHRVNLNHG